MKYYNIFYLADDLKSCETMARTDFNIVEVSDGIKLVPKNSPVDNLEFPKADYPIISEVVNALRGVVRFTAEEIEEDDRLRYILSR